MIDLKPCPFCSRQPAIQTLKDSDNGAFIGAWVECQCGAETSAAKTKDQAALYWNTRSPQGSAGS